MAADVALRGISSAFTIPFSMAAMAVSLVTYALSCLAIYRLAHLHGHNRKFLAFIPIANIFMMGRLADDVELSRGKRSAFRKILLILEIVQIACLFVFMIINIVFVVVSVLQTASYSAYPYNYYGYSTGDTVSAVLTGFSGILLFASMPFIWLASMAYNVFYYIALYRIYNYYLPKHSIVLIVLSIFLSSLYLFFAFAYMPEVDKKSADIRRVLRQYGVIPPDADCDCGHEHGGEKT